MPGKRRVYSMVHNAREMKGVIPWSIMLGVIKGATIEKMKLVF